MAFSSSAGESGDSLLHTFRIANNLSGKAHNELFITRRDLVSCKLTEKDTVVFLDDFAGTGESICNAWDEHFSELVVGAGSVYLLLLAATKEAKNRISNDTDLVVVPVKTLTEKDNIFSNSCNKFTAAEKATLLKYNNAIEKKIPKGYGDCGLLTVFHYRCPNNSIPILHKNAASWDALFPRN